MINWFDVFVCYLCGFRFVCLFVCCLVVGVLFVLMWPGLSSLWAWVFVFDVEFPVVCLLSCFVGIYYLNILVVIVVWFVVNWLFIGLINCCLFGLGCVIVCYLSNSVGLFCFGTELIWFWWLFERCLDVDVMVGWLGCVSGFSSRECLWLWLWIGLVADVCLWLWFVSWCLIWLIGC